MVGFSKVELDLGLSKYAKSHDKVIHYGTAGFRTKAEDLDHILFRMGILAVLRSRKTSSAVGVMITASHNAEPDNGVKLVDPHGEMLEQAWEKIATRFANVEDNEVKTAIEEIVKEQKIDMEKPSTVFIGRDTRPSSPRLAAAAIAGVQAMLGQEIDYGIVSTPMLHYFVTCENTKVAYGRPTQEGYYSKLSEAFKTLRGDKTTNGHYTPEVEFDGSNGVGALKMADLIRYLGDSLQVNIHNSDISLGKLNHKCGADYVKTLQAAPEGVPPKPNARCVSVDGDADRIVYYYTDESEKCHLLDGDRIATLVAGYLMEVVNNSGLELSMGVVQTAYANGSSTDYISEALKVPVACVPTGVKHLHHKALEFDIGVYFEANGHGTVVFSENAKNLIKSATMNKTLDADKLAAAERLESLVDLINETVGDAISDLLLVETVLHARGWNIQDWENTYTDLPNRLVKVSVKDRSVIKTTDAERKCVSPVGLQDTIDKFCSEVPKGRAFVRPSGTEDVVRVYAEADTQENCHKLARNVAKAVFDMAGGVGQLPTI